MQGLARLGARSGVPFLLLRRLSAALLAGAFLCWPIAAAASGGSSWPMMLGDVEHTSHTTDPLITNNNASTFGVKWAANLYNADLGSPVVAQNPRLGVPVVYVGTQRGDVFAFNAKTGQYIWSTNLGFQSGMQASPAVDGNGNVWAGSSFNAHMYKLNGATGAIECSIKAPAPIIGSPMIFTSAAGAETVYWTYEDVNGVQGALIATQASTCTQTFDFNGFVSESGSLVAPAYGTTNASVPVTLVGSQAPDAREYAVNAKTGAMLWNFPVLDPSPSNYDIDDAATISLPSSNAFPGGAAYFTTRFGDVYAVNLTTGSLFWYDPVGSSGSSGSRSSAALDGTHLVFGFGDNTGFGGSGGVYSVSAFHGTQQWLFNDSSEVISSPAIIGPAGNEVVAFGDMNGAFKVLDLATGTQLYSSQTGGYVTSSPAEAFGTVYVTSSSGFLYAYSPGGGNAARPSTAITSPVADAPVANPGGSLIVTGTSSDPTGVAAVNVAIQENGESGKWFNASLATYNSAPVVNQATLASPGATTTSWSFALPVPPSGNAYTVYANSVNTQNVVDRGANVAFTVQPSSSEPNLIVSDPYPAPGTSFTVHGTAFLPGEQVAISMFGNVVVTATAGANGFLPNTNVGTSPSAPLGPTSVTATGLTSGYTSSATIVIGNSWPQSGHDAMHTSFEPNDPSIERSLSLANNTVLQQSWKISLGAAVSSASIFGNTVFVGAATGIFSALAIDTGATLWTVKTNGRLPTMSTPAIDTKYEFFGGGDGTLYVFDPNGQQVKTVTVGGALTSPTIGNGQIYVASDNATINDISEGKLKSSWTGTLSGASHAAPAYDASNGTVVAVDDSGTVSGFNALTGTKRWKFVTGGAIVSSPLIVKGNVFVGSEDGHVYSLNESTGALEWAVSMTGPVAVSPVLTNATTTPVQITAIDSKGVVETMSGTGTVISTQNTGTANPVGLSAVQGNLAVSYSNGLVALIRAGTQTTFAWSYQGASGTTSQPVIANGTLYFGAGDGHFYAFSPQGAMPLSRVRAAVSVSAGSWACTTP